MKAAEEGELVSTQSVGLHDDQTQDLPCQVRRRMPRLGAGILPFVRVSLPVLLAHWLLFLLASQPGPLRADPEPSPASSESAVAESQSSSEDQAQAPAQAARPSPDANLSEQERSMKQRVKELAEGPPPPPPPDPDMDGGVLCLGCLFILGALAFPTVAMLLGKNFGAKYWAKLNERNPLEVLCEEEPSVKAFFEALRVSQATAPQPREVEKKKSEPNLAGTQRDFTEWAPAQIDELRKLFSQASRSKEPAVRQRVFSELARRLEPIKAQSAMPEWLPFWQLTASLEVLLTQLATHESDATASCLKTVASGLDLLEVLGTEKVDPLLISDPPVRLLTVDDDAVTRKALCLALKRAFPEPDAAPEGNTGLALAESKVYDVIFMDVEMPGMDGYEVCSRIHKTAFNHATPVVFVTRHGDFEGRARTALCGGYELIGKPFMALEITVKTLTLVLRSRHEKTVKRNVVVAKEEQRKVPVAETGPQSRTAVLSSTPDKVEPPRLVPASSSVEKATELIINSELSRAPEKPSPAPPELGRIHAEAQSLLLQAERSGLHAGARLGSVLEEFARKIIESPARSTPTAPDAAAAALDLLRELCAAGTEPSLTSPPLRILTVDDDPIALRALASSLQLVFGRPDRAESGEVAVTLALDKVYDVVFMDIMMPGMSGLEACEKIHGTEVNRDTPVIFVTSHAEQESKDLAAAAGGSGFIAKPIFSKEILLTALTFTLRGRLKRQSSVRKPDLAKA